MNNLIIISVIFIIIGGAISVFSNLKQGEEKIELKYHYKRKNFFMSRAEHECYDTLIKAIGNEYNIFPQVHLPTIVDQKVVGQNWNAAFRHISQKSVDYVLTDKNYLSPKLVIELDDQTHERQDRKDRDIEVERVLQDAGMPILRLENHGHFDPTEIAQKIHSIINK